MTGWRSDWQITASSN